MTPLLALVAALIAVAITYLVWRMRFTRPWIERIPLVLDLSLAVGLASAGTLYLITRRPAESVLYGFLIGLAWTGLIAFNYGLAWVLSWLPTFGGVDETIDLPGLELAQARRVLARRLRAHGYSVEEAAETAATIVARLVGNKVAWPRKLRPKMVRIDLAPETGVRGVRVRVRIRYAVPAVGLARHLRPMVEEIVRDAPLPLGGVGEEGEGGDTDLGTWMWLPIELVVVGVLIFTFAIVWFWASR